MPAFASTARNPQRPPFTRTSSTRALGPFTEVRRGRPGDPLKREIAVLVYSDAGPDSPAEEESVRKWIEAGGILLRFAGAHLAEQGDHLLPFRLRRGGRTIGAALSWETPAKPAPALGPAPASAQPPAASSVPAVAPAPSAPAATAAPPSLGQLKYGTQRPVADAAIYLADTRGYFKEAGVDLELFPFGSATEMVPALATG